MARPDGPGSREPSPTVSALPGFDPSRSLEDGMKVLHEWARFFDEGADECQRKATETGAAHQVTLGAVEAVRVATCLRGAAAILSSVEWASAIAMETRQGGDGTAPSRSDDSAAIAQP